MSDKFSLLKKVEIKLHDLYEQRQYFQFYDQTYMVAEEKKITAETTKRQKVAQMKLDDELEEQQRQQRSEQIKQRLNQPKKIGRLDNQRSEKPKMRDRETKKKPMPEDVLEMRRFLELVTDDYPEFMTD